MSKKTLLIFAVFTAFVALAVFAFGGAEKFFKSKTKTFTAQINKVVDGDTVELADGTRVRLIGVDCPEAYNETVNEQMAGLLKIPYPHYASYAQEAKTYLEKQINGQPVQLKEDSRIKDFRDPGGRPWLYLYSGDTFLNKVMVSEGYCFVETKIWFAQYDEFKEAEKSAQERKLGIWGKSI